MVMGGNFSVTLVDGDPNLLNEVFELFKDLENKWSRFKENSEVTKLNNAEGKTQLISSETVTLIRAMIRGNKITKGYFDPTTLPLLIDSGYLVSNKNPENKTVIPKSAKWPAEVSNIQIIDNQVTMPIGTTIDAGGIGKGLAADLAIEFLSSKEVGGALVNANGDVAATGQAPQGGPWIIGVENPLDETQELDQVRISNGAIATSSRVHQTWEKEGKKVHHLVNPLTGSMAITDVLSASVLCGSGADAEALAKVPFILEQKAAIKFIEDAGAEVLIIDKDLVISQSKGWEKFK